MAAFRLNVALMVASAARPPTVTLSSRVVNSIPASNSQDLDRDHQSFLQADISHEKLQPPNPAEWFGNFAEGESTYDKDGTLAGRHINSQINVLDGWDPEQHNPLGDRAVSAKWFQETKSGGAKEAWQSFSPAEGAVSMAGNHRETGEWYRGKGGTWQESYVSSNTYDPILGTSSSGSSQNLPAAWFDGGVQQLDGYGRKKYPGIGSPRNFLDWEERSVNTTLECKAAGCTANASLLAPFNFNTEVVKNCRLSVHFHPTDFDDWANGEYVDWVEVNNVKVSTKCHPYMDGCNKTARRPLLPCVSDEPLDMLMTQNGDFKIAAKISEFVDECPYNNNLLSAVPMITCLVSSKEKQAAAWSDAGTSLLNDPHAVCVNEMPLQCKDKGCTASVQIPVNKTCAGLGQCLLSVVVNQTDFDNGDGTPETIEFIQVDKTNVSSNLKPGKNPCKSQWSGSPLTPAQMNYSAVKDHVLNVTTGLVTVTGKISKYVDECASNGYLFDAMAIVTCSRKPASLIQTGGDARKLRYRKAER
jgi:hypothetical protein